MSKMTEKKERVKNRLKEKGEEMVTGRDGEEITDKLFSQFKR